MFAPGASRYLGAGLTALLVLAVLIALIAWWPLWILVAALVAAWIFFAVFLRDPDRAAGEGIVSAADGRVREVVRDGARWRISVFMNVTNVHVNRFPLAGRVESITTSGEGFRPAYRVDALHNLQRSYRIATAIGPVEVVQMTGIVARRLVSLVEIGDEGAKGSRLGMIVLGSRVDVLVPADRAEPAVSVGAAVHAGASTIARVIG
ncbi:MAG: phosphatidylserine decarboxylase [Thermoplasmata archaeon]